MVWDFFLFHLWQFSMCVQCILIMSTPSYFCNSVFIVYFKTVTGFHSCSVYRTVCHAVPFISGNSFLFHTYLSQVQPSSLRPVSTACVFCAVIFSLLFLSTLGSYPHHVSSLIVCPVLSSAGPCFWWQVSGESHSCSIITCSLGLFSDGPRCCLLIFYLGVLKLCKFMPLIKFGKKLSNCFFTFPLPLLTFSLLSFWELYGYANPPCDCLP